MQMESSYNPYSKRDGATEQTNIGANVLLWNVMGALMSMFIFVFDGMHAANRASGKDGSTQLEAPGPRMPGRVLILNTDHFSRMSTLSVIVGTLFLVIWAPASLITTIPHFYVAGIIGIPVVFWGVLYFFLYMDEKHHIYQRKYMMFWVMYAVTMPFVATAFFMLLQRRDVILNWSLCFIALAVGMCSVAIEIVQRSYEYAVQNGLMVCGFCRKKNMVIKIIMLCQCLMVGLMVLSALPVYPATTFSNSYQTILIVSVIISVPLALCARYLTDVSICSLVVAVRAC